MLVIISSPTELKQEAEIINSLFEEGMQTLHIRKPDIGLVEIEKLIKEIKPQYYTQLSLHQHHPIANDYGIKRLHFSEAVRKETDEYVWMELRKSDFILSTSIHSMDEYDKLSPSFNYTFLGPVFNSISKPGYVAAFSDYILEDHKHGPKVIAIGGIDSTNIEKAMNMKFDGVAVLGAIWQKPEVSLKQFKLLQKKWKATGR